MSFFLSCEALLATNCTVGDYVIEWRWNSRTGTPVFITGHGTDPAIQAPHPFYDEVVLAGTLYPVIRYVYFNGEKYTSTLEEGALYSPDFIDCFDPVVVDAVNCSSTLGTDPIYPYTIDYVNSTDGGLNRSRLIKYDLSADTYYLAWSFGGATVADQIKIYYCTLADPNGVLIENFISGINGIVQDLYPSNYPTNPKVTGSMYGGTNPVAIVTSLDSFTFQAGDYIKIQIIGSIYEPSVTNTNWTVKLKCLTIDGLDCSTFIADTGMSKITSTPTFTYTGDPTCAYKISYPTLDSPFVNLPAKSTSPSSLYRYFNGFWNWYGPSGGNLFGNSFASPVVEGLRWSTTAGGYTTYTSTSYNVCMNLQPGETITVSKVGFNMIYTFTDITDYNKYVSDIAAFKASANYLFWQGLTGSDSRYYAAFRIHTIVATSCGDIASNYYNYFFFGAPIAYDAIAKTITITCDVPTNTYVDSDCDNTYEQIASIIATMNGTRNINMPVPYVTHSRNIGTIYSYWIYYVVAHETTRETGYGIGIEDGLTNQICDLAALGFCKGLYPASPNLWILPKYWDRLSFTDPSTHETRMSTWKLERKVVLRTDNCADTAWELIAEGTTTTTTTTTEAPITTTTTTII